MKKMVCTLLLVGLALTSAQAAVVHNVDAPQARKMIAERSDLYLLDVRTPQEYFDVRLPGAHLIPIDKFSARIAEVPKDRPVLVYCAVGSRSAQVAAYLVRQGYSRIYNLNGGIWAWQLRQFPTLKGAP